MPAALPAALRAGPPAGPRLRPPTAADVSAIFELTAASDLAELGEVDYELGDVLEDLGRPGLDPQRDYWLAYAAERLAGAASVLDRPGHAQADADLVLHPAAEPAVAPALLARIARRAGEQAAAAGFAAITVTLPCATTNTARAGQLRAAGYTAVRRFSRLRLELDESPPQPPAPPAGVELRAAPGPAGRSVVHLVMTQSFAEHFGHTDESYDDWWGRQSARNGFDESLWWLAYADGEPAGALIGRRMEEQGWVQGLGVRPAYRGRGVGTLLLRAAVAEFHRRRQRRVELGVDTGNETGALRLYESVGMRPAAQHDLYQREVAAAAAAPGG